MLLVGAGMLAMFYLPTLYLQIVRGYSALHTGLAYLPFVVGLGIAAGGLGPRLLVKLPARGVIAVGLLIFAGGLVWYGTHLTPASNYFVAILPGLLAGGIGGGVTFVAATAVSVHGVAPSDSGAAAGLLNTGIQVGAALGLSGLASIASIVTRSRLPGHTLPNYTQPNYTLPGHTLAAALTDGYSTGLLAGAALFATAAVVALAAINARIEAGPVSGH
jgi:hypothetical protein